MLINQANRLQAVPGSPLPVTWVDCHIPHVDTIHPLALAAARRQAGTASANAANTANAANSANSAAPAPRRTNSVQNVCRNHMHLSDSASHPRFVCAPAEQLIAALPPLSVANRASCRPPSPCSPPGPASRSPTLRHRRSDGPASPGRERFWPPPRQARCASSR